MAERFQTTQWSVVVNAGGEGDSARDALSALCETYRPPVLAYVRARVRRREDAEDLTQAFFTQLLERRLASYADQERGRFRSFLLASLNNFLASERERASTQRRGGRVEFVPESAVEALADTSAGPEEAFDREWAHTVLREAMRRLSVEAHTADRSEMFAMLRPYLTENPASGDYDRIAEAADMKKNTVAVAVHRLRSRLQELVLEVVADTATASEDVDAEMHRMRSLMLANSKPSG